MKLNLKTGSAFILLFVTFLLSFTFLSILQGCKKKEIIKKASKISEEIPDVIYQNEYKLETGKRGGSFIRADLQEIDNLNVVNTHSLPVYSVLKLVFESLLMVNPYNGHITGSIAKDYKIVNNGLSMVLYLNNNVFFSDGVKCTADDVIFSFEKIYLNPDVDSKKIEMLKIRNQMVKVTRIDDYTVRFDLPVPYRPFLYSLTQLEILPKHILENEIKNNGIEWFNKRWGAKDSPITNLIGTGSYKISEYHRGKLIKLTRNSYYTRREGSLYLNNMPYLDEIIELLNMDNETKALKFEIGEIDFYDMDETDFENGNLDSLIKNRIGGNYNLYYSRQTLKSNHFLVFNQNPEAIGDKDLSTLFRDKRFRKALSLAIDRNAISKRLYKGYASNSLSPIRDSSPYYKSGLNAKYDPQKAIDILKDIGLIDKDGNGILELPSGKELGFSILTNSDNPLREVMGEMIVEYLKNIGIKATLKTVDYDLLITKLLDNFNWEAVIIGSSGSIEPNDLAWIWESNGPLHMWFPYQKNPSSPWEKRIDELFSMGRTTWDLEKAKNFYYEFQDIAVDFIPIINILTPYQIYGYRNDYKNLFPSPVTYNNIGILPFIYQR